MMALFSLKNIHSFVAVYISLPMRKITVSLLFILLWSYSSSAQHIFEQYYPDSLSKKRISILVGGESALYVGSMTALYFAWYNNYDQTGFHWFNDNDEWLQMDKVGHATTSAYMGKFLYEINRWAGIKRNNAIWLAGAESLFYLTTIEVLDGFSEKWGASTGDFIANTSGVLLFTGQQFAWDEQRFLLKYSFHESEIAREFPEKFGNSFIENTIKDYNGQTYWISGNISSFLPDNSRFPKWLNIAFGYSAEGMTGASSGSDRYRQYLFSLDIDLTRIETNSQVLKAILHSVGFIKVPFPALEYNSHKQLKLYGLYF